MVILLSPAKKMRTDNNDIVYQGLPRFLDEAERLRDWMCGLTREELKTLWKCNDAILEENRARLARMDLREGLTPAILAYDGIAYQYMAPGVFEDGAFAYVQARLRILSGFYGVLKPMDGVVPYRLEMQAKVSLEGKNLYDFWGRKLYEAASDGSGVFLNLASKEHSRCIERWLEPSDRMITCVFGEKQDGRILQKGVHVKMARGQMVRLMAEHAVQDPEEVRTFDVLGCRFCEAESNGNTYVFLKSKNTAQMYDRTGVQNVRSIAYFQCVK